MALVNGGQAYEVLEVLGAGGFGTVYRAKFLGEGGFAKEVALKVLNPDVEGIGEVASRLRDEARILGLLRHRAIVNVDRLTMIEGRWTVVMEYVEGWDLSRFLERGPIPPVAALEIVAEVAGALHAAFTRVAPNGRALQLLHRDLKPANIRVTPYGEVKVLDFGIARAEFDTREARTQSLSYGTPAYMAPERLDGQPDGPEGDVYALGVILYELLTAARLGKSSANPANHAKKLAQVQDQLEHADIDRALQTLVLACLAFDEQERPTADALEVLALELARRLPGPGLRSWVAGAGGTPNPSNARPALNLTSTILREGVAPSTVWEAGSGVAGPRVASGPLVQAVTEGAPPSTPRRTVSSPVVLALVLAANFLLGLGIVIWQRNPSLPVGSAEEEAVVTAAPTLPPEDPAPPPVTEVEPETPAEEAPKPVAPDDAPRTAPSATSPAAARPVAKVEPKANVSLRGDVASAELRGTTNGLTCRLPCSVTAGEYRIWADFGTGTPAAVGHAFTLTAPGEATVQCDASFLTCSVQR